MNDDELNTVVQKKGEAKGREGEKGKEERNRLFHIGGKREEIEYHTHCSIIAHGRNLNRTFHLLCNVSN